MEKTENERDSVCTTTTKLVFLFIFSLAVLCYFDPLEVLGSEYDRFSITILASHEIMFGGLLSGCLHALSGPDHLAALMPFIVGKSLYICVIIYIFIPTLY